MNSIIVFGPNNAPKPRSPVRAHQSTAIAVRNAWLLFSTYHYRQCSFTKYSSYRANRMMPLLLVMHDLLPVSFPLRRRDYPPIGYSISLVVIYYMITIIRHYERYTMVMRSVRTSSFLGWRDPTQLPFLQIHLGKRWRNSPPEAV